MMLEMSSTDPPPEKRAKTSPFIRYFIEREKRPHPYPIEDCVMHEKVSHSQSKKDDKIAQLKLSHEKDLEVKIAQLKSLHKNELERKEKSRMEVIEMYKANMTKTVQESASWWQSL